MIKETKVSESKTELNKLSQLSPQTILWIVFLSSLSLFLFVRMFHSLLYVTIDIDQYLVFHNLAEFFSIMVSLSIFGVGWYTFNQSKNRHVLFLSCAFLAIGLMDFMHTLSFPGMSDFITPNTLNKTIQFWIIVRIFAAAIFLISAFIYKDTVKRWLSKRILLIIAILVPVFAFIGVIFYPEIMPTMFIQDTGLMPFKIYSEYLIVGLLAITCIFYWKRFSKTGNKLFIFYIAAFIICIFSELAFTLYRSAFDTYNMLGHIYKIVAFFLIYKGIFISSVHEPYIKLDESKHDLRERIKELRIIYKISNIMEENDELKKALNEIIKHLPHAYQFSEITSARIIYNGKEYKTKNFKKTRLRQFAPISISDKKVGIVEVFYSKKKPFFVEKQNMLAEVASQIGNISNRKKAEKMLRKAYARLEIKVAERTADLKESNKMKDLFIDIMRHDLLNPVGNARLNAQVGLEIEKSPKIIEILNNIERSSDKVIKMIENASIFSKMESGKKLEFKKEDLSVILKVTIEKMKPEADIKKMEIKIKAEGKFFAMVNPLIHAVFSNVISNAIKYGDEKSDINIEIKQSNSNWRISVANKGEEIPDKYKKTVFERFTRIEKTGVKGSGLGLAITKKIVKIHKGKVWVKDNPEGGSIFIVDVPRFV